MISYSLVMSKDVAAITAELEQIGSEARGMFGTLTPEQVNWKPAPESWSIGQCLDHLIKSNELFFGDMDKIAAGTRQNSFWENWSPFTSFFGGLVISSLENDGRKSKASAVATPPSDVPGDIVERFVEHQDKVADKVRAIQGTDWSKVVLTSPFLPLMTYSLEDGSRILTVHERRHLRQAKRVMESEGFPR